MRVSEGVDFEPPLGAVSRALSRPKWVDFCLPFRGSITSDKRTFSRSSEAPVSRHLESAVSRALSYPFWTSNGTASKPRDFVDFHRKTDASFSNGP